MAEEFIDQLEYLGVILDCENFHTWGSSMIQDDDGTFHLYACQWPVDEKYRRWGFYKWDERSVVNHYASSSPTGPYTFQEKIIDSRPSGGQDGSWNNFSAHNPEVKRIDGLFVMTYISYPKKDDIPNARIGMKVSKTPYGPWEDVSETGMIMEKSNDNKLPSYGSLRGTDNPSLILYKGKYYLFFMYNPGPDDNTTLGVATSESLYGPYIEQHTPALVPGPNKKVEDICAFINNGTLSAVMCDNFGIRTANGGIYCELDEEIFERTGEVSMNISSIAWKTRPEMFPEQDFSNGLQVYGANKFERPKIATIDGRATYLFLPSGFNEKGNTRTALHGFRIKPDQPSL